MRTHFVHEGPSSLQLGLVVAEGVHPEEPVPALDAALAARLASLSGGLSVEQDAFRAAVRDVFRNGRYKPTGRGKPASEYLLRAASEDRFPRINTLVDICNYLSAASLLPISIWDLDRAAEHAGWPESLTFGFRLGSEGEHYVFNATGQDIALDDLIVGTVAADDGSSRPIVNAVKDSQVTKTTAATRRVAAAIYAPLDDGPDLSLREVCDAFVALLSATDPTCRCHSAILTPGDNVTMEP